MDGKVRDIRGGDHDIDSPSVESPFEGGGNLALQVQPIAHRIRQVDQQVDVSTSTVILDARAEQSNLRRWPRPSGHGLPNQLPVC